MARRLPFYNKCQQLEIHRHRKTETLCRDINDSVEIACRFCMLIDAELVNLRVDCSWAKLESVHFFTIHLILPAVYIHDFIFFWTPNLFLNFK